MPDYEDEAKIDWSNRVYPRWARRPGKKDVLVTKPEDEQAQFAAWDREDASNPAGGGKAGGGNALVTPPIKGGLGAALSEAQKEWDAKGGDISEPAAQFTVYDITTDEDVPLTQDRLDDLLTAEKAITVLWPAIRRDQQASATFPPATTAAIAEVIALLPAQASEDASVEPEATEAAPEQPKRRGRPPKPKPAEVADGTGT